MLPGLIKKMFAPRPVPRRFWDEFPIALMLRPSQIRAAAEDAVHMIPSAKALSASYAALSIPVAILAGDQDRVVDYEQQALRLHRALPASTIDIYSNVGHMLHHADVSRILRAIDWAAEKARQDVAAHATVS
jgi:pimeloyl-ACP methyl ester carboxylesterase